MIWINMARYSAAGPRGRIRLIGFVTLFAVAIALTACVAPTVAVPKVRAENAWARPATSGPDVTGAAYLTLVNDGSLADRLVGAQSDVASTVEIHETTLTNGVAQMQPVFGIDVPANGRVEIQPAGYHLMLIGLTRDLRLGDHFTIVLQFEKSGRLSVEAEVQ